MKTYGVIMAGGGGTRFWPLSTKAEPKQFLNLSGKDILVNETIDRQAGLIDKDDIFIVTNESQASLMLERTEGRVLAGHVLAEPAARNTAACIGYAAVEILEKYGDGVMCVFAADHHIREEAAYLRVMREAVKSGGNGRAGDHRDPSRLCLHRLRLYQAQPSGGEKLSPGRGICGKAGRPDRPGLSGIRVLRLEQRDVCLEGFHDSALV